MLNQSVGEFFQVNACDVIILEGILVFHDSRVRDLMNMKIFVDTGCHLNSRITSCSIFVSFPLFDLIFWTTRNNIVSTVYCPLPVLLLMMPLTD